MRMLFVTWDGAGAITPTVALIGALVKSGHEVHVLGHDSQQAEISQNGGMFHRYTSASQLNQNELQRVFDFPLWFESFNGLASTEFESAIRELRPEVLIVDCMMRQSLHVARASGIKFVAFVHAAYSAMAAWAPEIKSADVAICCSYPAFDKGADFPKNMVFVGPLRPAPAGETWSRNYPERPLVVASLSSGVQGSFQIRALQNVCDAMASLPVEALVTTGRGISPDSLNAPENVTVRRSVDHPSVLQQAALFLTHCGHGSIMIALRAGVPMLCMPPIADQPHNAALVRELGLGEVIDVLSPPKTIAEGVMRILTNPEISSRARDFAGLHTTEANPGLAVQTIEHLQQKKRSLWARLGFGSGRS